MERLISVFYPESLANNLKLGDKEFETEMKTISLVKLYEIGKVSSGIASKILGISRMEFVDKLSKYQVSIFNYRDESELNQDIANA